VTPALFHPNFGVFPLHQITYVGVSPSRSLKLFGREIVFEEFQPTGWSKKTVPQFYFCDNFRKCTPILTIFHC